MPPSRCCLSVAFCVMAPARTEKWKCSRRSIMVDRMAMPIEPPRLRITLDKAEVSIGRRRPRYNFINALPGRSATATARAATWTVDMGCSRCERPHQSIKIPRAELLERTLRGNRRCELDGQNGRKAAGRSTRPGLGFGPNQWYKSENRATHNLLISLNFPGSADSPSLSASHAPSKTPEHDGGLRQSTAASQR